MCFQEQGKPTTSVSITDDIMCHWSSLLMAPKDNARSMKYACCTLRGINKTAIGALC